MDLPQRFGKYELLTHLATGGMAEVFLARSFGLEGFQKKLVIKRILPALAREPRFVSMFIKEAKITAGLAHPNIVQIFELGRVGGDHYIAMEYLRGRNLAQINRYLRRTETKMPIPLAVYICANLLRGLSYAHSLTDPQGNPLNLVHRDVSPHNVQISFVGEVKLIDFGIARLTGFEKQRRTGKVGGGKYAYMSPEQASGLNVDNRSDLFSVGIVLYEMLVGHRLFQHTDPEEKLRLVREAVVPDPRQTNPDIHEELWMILKRLLTADRDERYSHAEMVEDDLWAFLFEQGLRVEAAAMSAFLKNAFADGAQGATVDVGGLADDVARMDAVGTEVTRIDSEETHESNRSDVTAGSFRALALRPGQRRTVAVLVAEVCGLTEPSLNSMPGEVVRKHYKLLRRIRTIVDAHDGILDSFVDETFVVFFGMKRAREDDLERALACAQKIHRLQKRTRGRLLSFEIAMGVHSGELTIGRRSGRSYRYLARGDTMKLARRLCVEADVGSTLISLAVSENVEKHYHLSPGPSFRLKGEETENTSFAVEHAMNSLKSPGDRWIRREDELEVLQEGLRALSDGRGGLMSIVGEGGVGKSRMIAEVARLARIRKVPCFASRALPYGGAAPLTPIRDLVAEIVGIDHDDDKYAIRKRLQRLSQLRMAQEDQDVIAAMFGISNPKRSIDSDRMFRAATVMITRLAEDQPLILVIDDVQHLAPLARKLIGFVLQGIRSSPVLFLATSRQEISGELGVPDWEIKLGNFAPSVQRAFACEKLNVKVLDDSLAAVLGSTTQGNPLHLELMIKTLAQAGRISTEEAVGRLDGEQTSMPPGMDSLISARVDDLGDSERRFLQIAATVGVSFPVTLVADAAGFHQVETLVDGLTRTGFVERTAEDRCAFCSPVVWEIIRRSVVGSRLQQQHGMVALAIEARYGDDIEVWRVRLARHCAAAGRYLDAAVYALHSGHGLERRQLLQEAADIMESGLEWLEQAPRSDILEDQENASVRLWLGAGRMNALLGNQRRAERQLSLAQEAGIEQLNSEIEAVASLELGRLYREMGRITMANAQCEAALQASYAGEVVANKNDVSAAVSWRQRVAVESLLVTGLMAFDAGDHAESKTRLERALEMAGSDDVLAANALLSIALMPGRSGDSAAALELLEQALEKARRAEERILLGRVVNNIGFVHFSEQRYEEALAHFRQSIELRQGVGYRRGVAVNYHNMGDTYLRMGDMGRAWSAFKRSRDLSREMGWAHGEKMNAVYIAFIEGQPHASEKSTIDPVAVMKNAVDEVCAINDIELEISARCLLGKLLIGRGDSKEANSVLDEAWREASRVEAVVLMRDIEEVRATIDP